jgi:hypothetical protein
MKQENGELKWKQPSIHQSMMRATLYDEANPKVGRANKLLVDMVCMEALPFRLLETPGFKSFVAELDPRYYVPSAGDT